MAASRGDTKPCTVANCSGTMQYGRRHDRDARVASVQPRETRAAAPVSNVDNVRGWVCTDARSHFRQG